MCLGNQSITFSRISDSFTSIYTFMFAHSQLSFVKLNNESIYIENTSTANLTIMEQVIALLPNNMCLQFTRFFAKRIASLVFFNIDRPDDGILRFTNGYIFLRQFVFSCVRDFCNYMHISFVNSGLRT